MQKAVRVLKRDFKPDIEKLFICGSCNALIIAKGNGYSYDFTEDHEMIWSCKCPDCGRLVVRYAKK